MRRNAETRVGCAIVAIWAVSLLLGITFWSVVIWAIIHVVSKI